MKKIKLLALLLAALLIVPFSFASCDTEKDDTSSDTESANSEDDATVPASIKEAGKVIMATNAYFPPYEFIDDDGNFAGIDVEIMEEIADMWGVELSIDNMEFSSILGAVQNGKADVGVAGMTVKAERLESVNFTHTYAKAKQVIIVKEDSEIDSIDALKDMTVGVQAGTTGAQYAVEDENIKAVEHYSKGVNAVLALLQDKIDAVIIDNEPANVFVEQNEGIKIIDEVYADEEYAICVAKENTELLEAMNKALETLDENGKLQEIIGKYINSESEYNEDSETDESETDQESDNEE